MTFDIKAPLKRQRTRDGRKILAIFDSGLDCPMPIVVWHVSANNEVRPYSLRLDGHTNNEGYSINDAITLPEQLPLIVSLHHVYDGHIGTGHIEGSAGISEKNPFTIATLKITFDPNSGISTSETAWQKEEAK